MANSAAGGPGDHNSEIIKEFRANQGRAGGMWGGHHAHPHPPHRRQVRDRARHPGGLLPPARRRFAIWAAKGGSPTHPNWYQSIKAHPTITAEADTQTFTVTAEELDDTARAELWPKPVAEWPKPVAGSPDLGAAQARTTRQFPVFMLTRRTDPRRRSSAPRGA